MTIDDVLRGRRLAACGLARAYRLAAGASLSEVAIEVGVSGPTISRWERNLRKPRGIAAARYAAVLDRLEHAARESS
jgi:transcriptional regulator with XRE-family HTH domain